MIRDLSETLGALLSEGKLPSPLAGSQVLFDRPTAQFNPSQSAINLFLFDIQENIQLRSNESTVIRREGRATVYRPPMRVDCSYLVTAWVVGGVDVALHEHLLLSQVLQVLARHPTIPESALRGKLKAASGAPAIEPERIPIPLSVAVPAASRQSAEFWTSLGIPVRASLIVTATIALDLNDTTPESLPLVTSHQIGLQDLAEHASDEPRFQIGGQIRHADQQPAGAVNVLLQRRQGAPTDQVAIQATTQTDQTGLYQFSSIPAGDYTVQVQLANRSSQNFPITLPPPHHSDARPNPFDFQLA